MVAPPPDTAPPDAVWWSPAGIALFVFLAALLAGAGYFLRKRGYLVSKTARGIWAVTSALPLVVALFWGAWRVL